MAKAYVFAIAACAGALMSVSAASAATAPINTVQAAPGTALSRLAAAAQNTQPGGQAVDPALDPAQPRVKRRGRFFGLPLAALAGLFGGGAAIVANDSGPGSS